MRWQQVTQKAIAETLSFSRKPFFSHKTGFRVLSYHSIGGHAFGDDLELNSISLKHFTEHVNTLGKYQVIPINNVSQDANQLSVAITFDDGYRDNLFAAAPILLKNNLPFTVFIATDLVSNQEQGFLSPSELKELARFPNAVIGAHGKSHRHLTKLSDREVYNELKDSKSYLEDLLGLSIESMSYPYGDANNRIYKAVQKAGFLNAFTSRFAINTQHTNPFQLNRCAILNGDSSRTLQQKIEGDWDWRGSLGNFI